MCIDIVSGSRKPYGFLFKNDLNEFVYTCSRCDDEFRIGLDLEHHIIGHDVKEENENEALDHCELPIELAPIEVLPPPTPPLPPIQPPFDPSGDCKSEVIAVDCSTKDEMGIYLPFDTPKLEINIEEKETHDEDEAETANAMDDDFPSNDFQADSSSSSDDFFPPPKSKKKPQKKTNKTNKSNKESKKKTYHCEICSRVFTSLARIKQHMIAGHVKKKKPVKRPLSPTLCTLCGKYIRDMKPHLKVFHSTERPFKCDYCDATFKQKVHRDTHVRQHTGEKPYVNYTVNFSEQQLMICFFLCFVDLPFVRPKLSRTERVECSHESISFAFEATQMRSMRKFLSTAV